MSEATEKFYVVVGPNTNSQAEGRIATREAAEERARYWARLRRGESYYVMEAVSVSRLSKITRAL